MRGVSEPTSYRAAYARLSTIAAELESGDADLDRVLPLLEEAKEAYAACRGRIEAVRAQRAGAISVPTRAGEIEESYRALVTALRP